MLKRKSPTVVWFKDLSRRSLALAGGKGANLGEMLRAGFPVPNGFVVSAPAYFSFLKQGSLAHKIKTELTNLDTSNSQKLQEASKKIQTAILATPMPKTIQKQVARAYQRLSGNQDQPVAVRSSATAEDLPEASFAGQQETYLNVVGTKDVIAAVHKCWASLFTSRAIFYRQDRGFDHFQVGIAVPIQLMIQSEVSGVMFTVNPMTSNPLEVAIEAGFGLGQTIVSGEITPDQYTVIKKDFRIADKVISPQTWQLTRAGKAPVAKAHQKKQKLADKFIVELAKIGAHLEEHYQHPQDVEWGFAGGKIYIVQTRPVTTLKIKGGEERMIKVSSKDFLLEGLPASPGVGCGKVRQVKTASGIRKVKKGEILVTEMTDPDYVPAMKKAVAIVTDKGGVTSHAAIVSRELGIPCVVGTRLATQMLKTGETITVDGRSGRVYAGDKTDDIEVVAAAIDTTGMKTATKVYVNLAEPELAAKTAARNVDGVGLLRAEFMIAEIGKHPRKFLEDKKKKEFVDRLAEGLVTFTEAFNPRPVVYRATDFKTNEYRNLTGGQKYEDEEQNPMIGFRGVSRYIVNDDVFAMELDAIKKVRNKLGFRNLQLMLPFIRTVDELITVKKIITAAGLRRSTTFKLWIMVEVPSSVLLLDELIDVGIDGVSIGSNDLTMLILGVDRDNEKVANVYDERNPAVLKMLEQAIKTCHRRKITSSICGQAPSVYPSLTKKLVDWGITSVSVAPDVIDKTRVIVYEAERELVKKKG